ncbi:MAG TPA: DUF2304 domain-containing protein [bacterium]
MYLRTQIISVIASLIIAGFIFELIRKRRLMEKYSLWWFGSAIVLLVFSFWRDLLEKLAFLLGIEYAPSVLLIIIVFCGFAISLHFTVVISKLTEQNKILAQEVALLRNELHTMKSQPA